MFAWITKLLPALTSIFTNIFSGSARAEEIRAQIELEEARAFQAGRYAPRYVLKYVVIGVFAVIAIVSILAIFFPSTIDLESAIDALGRLGNTILSLGE